MAKAIQDCEILLARGMGQGAHISLRSNNIKPVLTDIQDIREAVDAYLAGKLVENPSRVH
jgi:predicted Fe-Mo cluster-binding NifX family protein